MTARALFGNSYQQAGRTTDAITLKEHVCADYERLLGPEHPDTLTAYQQAGSRPGRGGQ